MTTRLERALRDHLTIVRDHGNEWDALCPVHDDSRPSARINIRKGVWYCHTCGEGGRLTRLIKEITGEVIRGPREVVDLDALEQALLDQPERKARTYPDSYLKQFTGLDADRKWHDLRRMSLALTREFELGYDAVTNALTIPIRDRDRRLLGVQRRFLDGEVKYKHPYGLKITDTVFGLPEDRGHTALWLCEGAISTLACKDLLRNYEWGEHGYPFRGPWNIDEPEEDAVGLWSANISAEQANIIRSYYPSNIVLAFDHDNAGYKAAIDAFDVLRKNRVHVPIYAWRWPDQTPKGMDMDDLRLSPFYNEVLNGVHFEQL